ncbi:hypothetical protein [Spirosoma sp. KNUC1025]|uniref:hypothetical protein n=1 Tax=Spirosoma sp. KNUC1025 TaxID=2894082 RepID=UPI00386345C8|nr:hypothetical protein LN737_26805 [Spirosoma sp. KNUC1025]
MTSKNQDKVEEIARKGEAIVGDALAKADSLLAKTATLRYQVNLLKDGLAKEIAVAEQKKRLA